MALDQWTSLLVPQILDEGGATGWNHLPALWSTFGVPKPSPCVIKAIQKMAQKNVLGGTGGEFKGPYFVPCLKNTMGIWELMEILQVFQFGSCSLRDTINY